MIKIKDLAEQISDAQDHLHDRTLFIDLRLMKIYVHYESYDDEEFNFEDPMIKIVNVDSFSRDLYLEFIYMQDINIQNELLLSFRGPSKYSRTKDLFYYKGIRDSFHAFEFTYQLKLAKSWCDENNISYEDIDGPIHMS